MSPEKQPAETNEPRVSIFHKHNFKEKLITHPFISARSQHTTGTKILVLVLLGGVHFLSGHVTSFAMASEQGRQGNASFLKSVVHNEFLSPGHWRPGTACWHLTPNQQWHAPLLITGDPRRSAESSQGKNFYAVNTQIFFNLFCCCCCFISLFNSSKRNVFWPWPTLRHYLL